MKKRPAVEKELATPRGQRRQQADAARKRTALDARSKGIETDVAALRKRQKADGELVAAKARGAVKLAQERAAAKGKAEAERAAYKAAAEAERAKG